MVVAALLWIVFMDADKLRNQYRELQGRKRAIQKQFRLGSVKDAYAITDVKDRYMVLSEIWSIESSQDHLLEMAKEMGLIVS